MSKRKTSEKLKRHPWQATGLKTKKGLDIYRDSGSGQKFTLPRVRGRIQRRMPDYAYAIKVRKIIRDSVDHPFLNFR